MSEAWISDEEAERFYSKVSPEPNSGCWLWTANANQDGYGRFVFRKKLHSAHRVSYEMHKGSIPPGYQVDHLCRVKGCVNPDHLEAVTPSVNSLRSPGPEQCRQRHAAITHCPHGHPRTPETTYYRRNEQGYIARTCKPCVIERSRAARRKKANK